MKRILLRVLLVVVLLVIGFIIGERFSTPGEQTSIPKVEETINVEERSGVFEPSKIKFPGDKLEYTVNFDTPKVEETLTMSEVHYLKGLNKINKTVTEALIEPINLAENHQIGNNWTIKIETAYEELIKMNPPDSLKEVHSKYAQAISCYIDMTYLLVQGIDNNDSGLINKAALKLLEADDLLDEATTEMDKFNTAHGW